MVKKEKNPEFHSENKELSVSSTFVKKNTHSLTGNTIFNTESSRARSGCGREDSSLMFRDRGRIFYLVKKELLPFFLLNIVS